MSRSLTNTKHFQIARQLREEFAQLRPGEPVLTVQQIKDRFNVSQATVTRALDRLKNEGLIFRPAGKSRFILNEVGPKALQRVTIIRPTWPSPDYDAIVRALVSEGERRNWSFRIEAVQSLEELDLNRAVGSADGAFLLPERDRFPQHVAAAIRKPRKPVVVLRDVPEDLAVDAVSLDDEAVGRQAVEHLASLGHRRILAVVSEPQGRSMFERTVGFRNAMRALGDEAQPLLLDCAVRPGQNSLELTYQTFRRWLVAQMSQSGRPPFTAVFCVDWTGALPVMRVLREDAGLTVPGDVSLVAFAGESLIVPYLNPPLTSVEADVAGYGKVAVDLLQRRLDGDHGEHGHPQHIRLPSSLVGRDSTASLAPAEASDFPQTR